MIGIFGGSFDPVHYGHLNSAISVKKELKLSQLFLMPCAIPAHKTTLYFDIQQRVKMLKLALQEFNELSLDKRETQKQGICFTIDSLIQIKHQYPDTQICLILGMDSFNQLSDWKQYQVFHQYCHLVVVARPDFQTTKTYHYFKPTDQVVDLHKLSAGLIYFANATMLDVSSTMIRNKICTQKSLSGLLPKSVIDYIKTI